MLNGNNPLLTTGDKLLKTMRKYLQFTYLHTTSICKKTSNQSKLISVTVPCLNIQIAHVFECLLQGTNNTKSFTKTLIPLHVEIINYINSHRGV